MDAYLEIAISVLKREMRPLSSRAIMALAYKARLVPTHLHGKTQQKTLGARISEDIVVHRNHSAFFRTAPGRFFLREFLADVRVPEEFRQPIPTRRRFRDLVRGPVLAIERRVLSEEVEKNVAISPAKILRLLAENRGFYAHPREGDDECVFIRSFVCVQRTDHILTYRLGRYRDDRDSFTSRRTVGFSTLVHMEEHTLFNLGNYGIVDAGVEATKVDLDIPEVPGDANEPSVLSHFVWAGATGAASDLLAVVVFRCPDWFEPTKRRLALNDLTWLDRHQRINNIEDFDPWSIEIIKTFQHPRSEIF